MNVLIIGLGIGQVYKEQLEQDANFIVTVDANPKLNPCFVSVDQAVNYVKTDAGCRVYDIGIICTPNFTHKEIAYQIAPICNVVVVEKPGLRTAEEWIELCATFPNTKILMAKNNMYRPQNRFLKDAANPQLVNLEKIEITWDNKNRVPKPGTWFTTKELAWGGVSRDLMPHLIHMAENLGGPINASDVRSVNKRQNWQLEDLTGSEYGSIIHDGVYDVDDFACFTVGKNFDIECLANWKNGWEDKRNIKFLYKDGSVLTYDFGLCSNYVYGDMIKEFVDMDHYDYQRQMNLDIRVHEILELFD